MARYEVLYRAAPAWLVPDGSGLPYPDDYAGKVIAVRPVGHKWGPGDLKDPKRRLVQLDLTDEELVALRSRMKRIDSSGGEVLPPWLRASVVDTTFDDRWGRLAGPLRERFADPEAAELESEDPENEVGRQFGAVAVSLKKALPPVVVRSGAGLYEVGPGKTYSTIQSAFDQLWTDQGSALFTASQCIRVFAGTYTEDVVPNAGLNPDEEGGYTLILEGDPDDSRENIVLERAAAGYTVSVSCDEIVIRHLKFDTTDPTAGIGLWPGIYHAEIHDCVFTPTNSGIRVGTSVGALRVTDCDFTIAADHRAGISYGNNLYVARCSFTRTAGGNDMYGVHPDNYGVCRVESCTFRNFPSGIGKVISPYKMRSALLEVVNCTFYSCSKGIWSGHGLGFRLHVFNSIFKNCPRNIRLGPPPEETEARLGPAVLLRNNCYHGYTNFAYAGGAYKTYSEFTAYGLVDAGGDLDGTDPLLTNPGGGDFSLQAGSPCRHAGAGAGVVTDVDGTAFDPYHPDIGGWSSGEISAPGRPSYELEGLEGDVLSISVSGEGAESHRAELFTEDGSLADHSERDGDGSMTLQAPERARRYFLTVSSSNAAGRSLPAGPAALFVPSSGGSLAELREELVTRLSESQRIADVLGTDESGHVPVYSSYPARTCRTPCIVLDLECDAAGRIPRPGRLIVRLAAEARCAEAGQGDELAAGISEVLSGSFELASFSVRRIVQKETRIRGEASGRVEVRSLVFQLVLDRK